MFESVDRYYQCLLLKDIYLLGPALHILVIFLHAFTGKLYQIGSILFPDRLVLQDFRNEFFQKERGVDMSALLYLCRQEDELHQFDVVGDDGIV